VYTQLSKEGVLHSADYRCQHVECDGNVVDMRPFENSPGKSPKPRRWCTYEVPISTFSATTQKSADMEGLANGNTHHISSANNAAARGQCLQALEALNNIEQMSNRNNVSQVTAANSRWNMLEKLQKGEVEKCPFTAENARLGGLRDRQQASSNAVARGLDRLVAMECGGPTGECDTRQATPQSDALARGLDTLVAMEAAELDDNWGPNGIPLREISNQTSTNNSTSTSPYLRRHRYELPPDRALRFATVTPAWKEAGLMPPVTYTASTPDLSLPSIANADSTSTGAMMEFLGPNIGAGLDFVNEMATQQIPLQHTASSGAQQSAEYTMLNGNCPSEDQLHNWYQGNDHWVDESVLLQDLDDLIAAYPGGAAFDNSAAFNMGGADLNEPPAFDLNAGMADQQQAWTAEAFAPMTTATAAPDVFGQGTMQDVAMEDVNFEDMMFDFDSLADEPGLHN
jgi:hypothetical protein